MKKFVVVVCISLLLISGMVGLVQAEDTVTPIVPEPAELSTQSALTSSEDLPYVNGQWSIPPVRRPEIFDYLSRFFDDSILGLIKAEDQRDFLIPDDPGGGDPGGGDPGGGGGGAYKSSGVCYAYAGTGSFGLTVLGDGMDAGNASIAGGLAGTQAPLNKDLKARTFGIYDFSEKHAVKCNWYNTTGTPLPGNTSNDGGNYFMLANLFSKMGTTLEDEFEGVCDLEPANLTSTPPQSLNYQKTLLDWRIISTDTMADTDLLKYYVYKYGPVYSSMDAGQIDEDGNCVGSEDSWCRKFNDYGYFPDIPEEDEVLETLYHPEFEELNHAVLIVGWDDTLPHEGGEGAWIVRNNWGTEWGDEGYFYIAYGSAGIGHNTSFLYDWQDYDPTGGILYYDRAGRTAQAGYGPGKKTAWGLIRFIPDNNGYATRVEFWTIYPQTVVDVYIYDGFDNEKPDSEKFGTELTSQLGNLFNEPGYHSVKLDTPVPLEVGKEIVVKARFSIEDYQEPLPENYAGPLPIDTLVLPTQAPADYENYRNLSYMSSNESFWMDTVKDEIANTEYKSFVAVRLRYTGAIEDSPNTSSYFVFDEYGGTWHDAEKSSQNTDDDRMCWAAAASNILYWTGWDASFGSEMDIFGAFQQYWTDAGGLMEFGWQWWFDGTAPPALENWAQLNNGGDQAQADPGGNYYTEYDFFEFFDDAWAKWDSFSNQWLDGGGLMSMVKDYLQDGYGTTLAIYSESGGHALSVWGYEYDDLGNYTGLWITDSDDYLYDENDLKLISVTYDLQEDLWFLDIGNEYMYDGWFISGVQALKRFPDDSDPGEPEEPPIDPGTNIPEPGTFVLLGCGLLGILTLRKCILKMKK